MKLSSSAWTGARAACLDRLARLPYPIRQAIFGTGYALRPNRWADIPGHAYVAARDFYKTNRPLVPAPERALARPDGLCGLTGRLDTASLVRGYARGMFVFNHIGPLKWWAPRQRMALFFDRAKVEKSTRRLLRAGRFEITFDQAFDDVVKACAEPRPGKAPLTWITPEIRRLFGRAFADGYAHSVEVRSGGELVGGLYGLAIGRVFFTESQFHTVRDASKVAFAALNRHLQRWGFAINDGKDPTGYLADAGFLLIERNAFCRIVESQCALAPVSSEWAVENDLLDGEWAPASEPGCRMSDFLADRP